MSLEKKLKPDKSHETKSTKANRKKTNTGGTHTKKLYITFKEKKGYLRAKKKREKRRYNEKSV